MKKLSAVLLVVSGLAIGLALNGVVSPAGPSPTEAQQQAEPAKSPEEIKELTAFAGKLEELFRYATDRVKPSVVLIQSTKIVERRAHPFPFRFRGPLEDLFRRQFPDEMLEPRKQRKQGLGSGVILDQEGNVLTNNHVIAGADELKVTLGDGREFDAEVAGTDDRTDLAVIRLQGDFEDLPTAELGDSDELGVGQWVLAVGNPFGLTQTVSAGIVSATGRMGAVSQLEYGDLIQTDAAINPGNSGGPLINLRGQVVGINTAIFSQGPTPGYMGIGFAVPVNAAKSILDALIAGREVVRGWLGVSIGDLTPDMAEMFNYEGTDGVLVNEVIPGNPAEEAGLKAGDIIVRYNGQKVEDMSELLRLVANTEPGSTVEVVVRRNGERRTFEVTVTKREKTVQAADGGGWLGLEVRTVTDEIARRLGEPELEGVLVTEVSPESPAARYLSPGNIVLSVNRQKVTSATAFNKAVGRVEPGNKLLLRVLDPQSGRTAFMVVRRPPE